MSPAILVAGATGNTGRGVVKTLSELRNAKQSPLSDYSIIALTRSAKGAVAQQFAQLPGVQVVEKSWVETTPEWLRENNVARAFIASHNQPNQFAEESTFLLALLQARVEYVVRISTTAVNVRPDCPAYYPRTHWAIEALLESEPFSALKWSSLQANIFTAFLLAPVAEFVDGFKKTGKQTPLKLLAAENVPVGAIDSEEVGAFAAHLLSQDDVSKHHKVKYILNGPQDVTGREIVELLEKHIGAKVEDVRYEDESMFDVFAANAGAESKNVISSIRHSLAITRDGKSTVSTTSPGAADIYSPKNSLSDIFQAVVQG